MRSNRHLLPLYSIWTSMNARCYCLGCDNYKRYGARGITVCDEWRYSYEKFEADIHATIGKRPSKYYSLDRIDNNGPYQIDNVRWATRKEQSQNTRRSRYFTINGETKNLTDWSLAYGIDARIVSSRLKRGWDPERAFSTKTPGKKRPRRCGSGDSREQ